MHTIFLYFQHFGFNKLFFLITFAKERHLQNFYFVIFLIKKANSFEIVELFYGLDS